MAESGPLAEGVKVRMMVQVPEAAMVPPLTQFPPPALAKLVALAPVMVKKGVDSVSVAVPTLVTVIVSGALVVPVV